MQPIISHPILVDWRCLRCPAFQLCRLLVKMALKRNVDKTSIGHGNSWQFSSHYESYRQLTHTWPGKITGYNLPSMGAQTSVVRLVRQLFFSSLLSVVLALAGAPSFANEPPKSIKIYFLSGFIYDFVHKAASLVEEESRLQGARLNIPVTFKLRWCTHWRAVAKEIAGLKSDDTVVVIGHSWGGSAAVELAHKLNKRKRPIDLLITIDSVPIPGSLKTSKIPPNVAFCCHYYQTRDVWRSYRKSYRDSVENDPNVQNVRVEFPLLPSPLPHIQIPAKVAPVISYQIGQLMLGRLEQIRMPETLDQPMIDRTIAAMKLYLNR